MIREQGDLHNSAVHVVESAPPSANASRPARGLRGESDVARRPRTETVRHLSRVRGAGRSEESRYAQVRSRVGRMENWLNQLNASLTALERRTSPEESRQYIPESEQNQRNTEAGPMPVSVHG